MIAFSAYGVKTVSFDGRSVVSVRGYLCTPYDQRLDVSPRWDGTAGLDCSTMATA